MNLEYYNIIVHTLIRKLLSWLCLCQLTSYCTKKTHCS